MKPMLFLIGYAASVIVLLVLLTFYVEYDWLGVLLVIINAAAWHYIFKRFLL